MDNDMNAEDILIEEVKRLITKGLTESEVWDEIQDVDANLTELVADYISSGRADRQNRFAHSMFVFLNSDDGKTLKFHKEQYYYGWECLANICSVMTNDYNFQPIHRFIE